MVRMAYTLSEKSMKFQEIEATLHEEIREDARNKARTLLSKLSGRLVMGPLMDEDLAAAIKEYDNPQNTSEIAEAYKEHVTYGSVVNQVGHSLALKCHTSYKPYDPKKDRQFFNISA